MKKSEYQKFQDFKVRHNLTDAKISKIMNEYAITPDENSASFFTQKYNISEHVFYKIRDYAIIFMLVSPLTCKQIRDKSLRNQIGHNPSGNYNTALAHYYQLIDKRREYLDSFSNVTISEIALQYSIGASLYEIANKYQVSTETVRKLIALALVNHLIDGETYRRISFRSNLIIVKLRGKNIFSAESLWNSYQTGE